MDCTIQEKLGIIKLPTLLMTLRPLTNRLIRNQHKVDAVRTRDIKRTPFHIYLIAPIHGSVLYAGYVDFIPTREETV